MSIQVTAIKVAQNPPTLSAITDYLFEGKDGEGTYWYTKAQGVDFVRRTPQTVWVGGSAASAWVEVVDAATPYLRSKADGTTTDNLLSLPVS